MKRAFNMTSSNLFWQCISRIQGTDHHRLVPRGINCETGQELYGVGLADAVARARAMSVNLFDNASYLHMPGFPSRSFFRNEVKYENEKLYRFIIPLHSSVDIDVLRGLLWVTMQSCYCCYSQSPLLEYAPQLPKDDALINPSFCITPEIQGIVKSIYTCDYPSHPMFPCINILFAFPSDCDYRTSMLQCYIFFQILCNLMHNLELEYVDKDFHEIHRGDIHGSKRFELCLPPYIYHEFYLLEVKEDPSEFFGKFVINPQDHNISYAFRQLFIKHERLSIERFSGSYPNAVNFLLSELRHEFTTGYGAQNLLGSLIPILHEDGLNIIKRQHVPKKSQMGVQFLNHVTLENTLLFHAENIELLVNGLSPDKMQPKLLEIHHQLGHNTEDEGYEFV